MSFRRREGIYSITSLSLCACSRMPDRPDILPRNEAAYHARHWPTSEWWKGLLERECADLCKDGVSVSSGETPEDNSSLEVRSGPHSC